MLMPSFRIIPFLHTDEEDKTYFYAVQKRRWFLFIPYWSLRVFKNSEDYCYVQYRSEGEEIIEVLKHAKKRFWNWKK